MPSELVSYHSFPIEEAAEVARKIATIIKQKLQECAVEMEWSIKEIYRTVLTSAPHAAIGEGDEKKVLWLLRIQKRPGKYRFIPFTKRSIVEIEVKIAWTASLEIRVFDESAWATTQEEVTSATSYLEKQQEEKVFLLAKFKGGSLSLADTENKGALSISEKK